MTKGPFISALSIVFLVLAVTSCTRIATGIYGMKKLKPLDEKTILRYSKKYGIPIADNYEIDTSYFPFLFSLDTVRYKTQIHNHYQPLQALYFAKTGELESFQINCYAGGFPNLKWNGDGVMINFPPKTQAPLDSILSFEKQLTF